MLDAKWVAMLGVVAPMMAAAALLYWRRRDAAPRVDAERIHNAGRLVAGGGVRRIV
jgi:hypothetical protein